MGTMPFQPVTKLYNALIIVPLLVTTYVNVVVRLVRPHVSMD